MLWSDPCDQEGRFENSRGCACEFGPDVVDRFFANNPPLNMIIRSHECEDEGYAEWFDGKLYTVFSCSNYQGTVDNDGAFCVLEKGQKPRFIRYYAQKDLKAGSINQRHHRLKEDIVTKLLTRICAQRLGLINYFVKQDEHKSGVVTRHQWSQGLQTVLGLHIPFLQFQQYLGLPELGVDGKAQGPIDYMDFCNRYLVYSQGMSNTEGTISQAANTSDFFAEMMSVMFARRYELESLFRFFDLDGNGSISREEFQNGLSCLATILGKTFTQEQVMEIVDSVDTDGNGEIDYNEFFDKFHTVDASLISTERMVQTNSKRATHVIGELPSMSDVITVDTAVQGSATKGVGLGRLHKVPLKGQARLAKAARVVIAMNRLTGNHFMEEKTSTH
jgi:Ca2+-binding EF-hand superfamily protein